MNLWLIVAAVTTAFLAVAHSYLGERFILIPLLRQDLRAALKREQFQKTVLRFAWHLTSIAWLGFGVLLVGLGRADAVPFAGRVVAATFLIHAIVTGIATRFRHLAWPLFLVVAGGAWWGTRV